MRYIECLKLIQDLTGYDMGWRNRLQPAHTAESGVTVARMKIWQQTALNKWRPDASPL